MFKTKNLLRKGLISLLVVNSLLSFASLIFFTAAHAINQHCDKLLRVGTGLEPEHPTYGAVRVGQNNISHGAWSHTERGRLIPWQVSCIAIFGFSIILLVSAWFDLRDEEAQARREDMDTFGEKGEIFL